MKLKCGLEIHQRLATRTKLFCDCPARVVEDEKPSAEVERSLKAVYGELGELDPAAEFEAGRKKSFGYQVFPQNSCLVELDEAPPREINSEALRAAVEIALLLDAKILGEVHVMRKTVIDGSSPSAFQRTALVAVDGRLETSFGKLKIPTVCLEEESAGIVGREGNRTTYRLDRLGIPLVEIATDASISSGGQAREVAEKIGSMLRSTGKVQRGIGSIRQDVNVSVEGGARVEVKGAQELGLLPKIVENEALRQKNLLAIKSELEKRGAKSSEARHGKNGSLNEASDVSEIFSQTNCGFIRKALGEGKRVAAVRLRAMAGIIGMEVMPGQRFGTELSDYAKAYAGVTGIIHSDEDLGKYGISREEAARVAHELGCGRQDGWAVCVAEEKTAQNAIRAVLKRAESALETGVVKETRRAEGEKSVFMRPLPGAARMYPETDVPPVQLANELVESIGTNLPESLEEKIAKLEGRGLAKQLAEGIARSGKWREFEQICSATGAEPGLVASTLLQTMVALSREGVAVEKIGRRELEKALAGVASGEIVKAAVPEALAGLAQAKRFEQVVREKKLARISGKALEKIVEESGGGGDGAFEKIMRARRLNVDPAELRALLEARSFKRKPR